MKEPAPLSDDLLDYLAAEREPEVPSAATRERMFTRIAPFVLPPLGGLGGLGGSGAPGAGSATGGGAGVASAVASAWKGKLVIAAIAAAVGAGGGAAGHAMLAAPRSVPILVASPITPVLSASRKLSLAAPTAEATAEPVAPEASAAVPSGSARAEERPKGPVGGPASLRAERLLIETANAALLRGDHASAIASLRKHARSFPKGELAQEREVLLVQALRASGDDGAAQERAKDFKRKFPNSLQQESVNKSSRP